MVEQGIRNAKVVGSTPISGTSQTAGPPESGGPVFVSGAGMISGILAAGPTGVLAMSRLPVFFALLPFLLACGASPAMAPGAFPVPDDFYDQPAMEALREGTPEGLGFTPETGEWREAADGVSGSGAFCVDAGAAADELAGRLEPSPGGSGTATIRQHRQDDRLMVLVQRFGFQDDAVAGDDIRVMLRRDDGCWVAEAAERRVHCRRGLTGEGQCR